MHLIQRHIFSIFTLISLLFLAPNTLAVIDEKAAKVQSFYEDALERFNNSDYSGSIVQLKNVFQNDPDNLPAKILTGRANLRLGNFSVAEQELSEALIQGADPNIILIDLADAKQKLGKFEEVSSSESFDLSKLTALNRSKLLTIVGIACTRLNRTDDAEKAFNEAITLAPSEISPRLAAAGIAFNQGNLDRANKMLAKVEALKPKSIELWELKARFDESLGNKEAALKHYQHALQISPNRISVKNYMAHLLMSMNRQKEALEIIEPPYKKNSFDPDLSYTYAMSLIRNGRASEAKLVLTEANAALSSIPDEVKEKLPNLQILSSLAAFQSGDYEVAIRYATMALQRFPRQINLRVILAESLLQLEQYEEALNTLSALPLDEELSASTLALFSHTLLLNGRYSEANTILERLVEEGVNSSTVLANLGLSQLAIGKSSEAASSLEHAIETGRNAGRAGFILTMAQLAEGDYLAAEVSANRMISQLPNNPVPYNLLSLASIGKGDLDQGKKQVQRALEIAPDYVHANLTAAKIDFLSGEEETARLKLQSALDKSPNNVQIMAALANLADVMGEEDQAIKWLEKARVVDGNRVELAMRLMEKYSALEEHEKSLKVAEELAEVHPDQLRVFIAYAKAQLAAGKRGFARSTLRKTLHFPNLRANDLLTIAMWQMRVGDPTGAILSLNDAVNSYPDYLPAAAELIKLESRLDNQARAHELIETHVSKGLDQYPAEVLKAYIYQSEGKLKHAEQALQKAMKLKSNAPLAVQLFQIISQLGDTERGVELMEEWSRKEPKNQLILNNLAIGYERSGDLQKARDTYLELIQRNPNEPSFRNNLALIYIQLGDNRAVKQAEMAFSIAPENAAFLDTYGWSLSKNDRPEEGIRYLRDAFSRSSEQPSVRYHLAETLVLLGEKTQAADILHKLLTETTTFREYDEAKSLLDSLNP